MVKLRILLLVAVAFALVGCAKEPADNSDLKSAGEVSERSGEKSINTTTEQAGPGQPMAIATADGSNGSQAVPARLPTSTLLTDETFGAVVLYPKAVLANPSFEEVNLAELMDAAMPDVGFSVTDLEQVVWLLTNPEKLRRTLVVAPMPGAEPPQAPDASKPAAAQPPAVEPPVPLDDLFKGLEPAKPVPPEENRDFESDDQYEVQPPNRVEVPGDAEFHAFDLYWTPQFMPMILRFTDSSKANRFVRSLTMDMSAAELDGIEYFKQPAVSGTPPAIGPDTGPAIRQYLGLGPMSVYVPDAFTVVLATEPRIEALLRAADDPREDAGSPLHAILDTTSPVAGAAAFIDFQHLRSSGAHLTLLEELADHLLSSRMALLNLADDAESVTLQVDVNAEALIQLDFRSLDAPAARERLARDVRNIVNLLSQDKSPAVTLLAPILDELVQSLSVEESESGITLSATRPSQFDSIPHVLAAILEQIVVEAEESIWRHCLAQIATAMHSYASEHQRIPPAATYDESGKPLLSWRVHLLPYLGHDQLHQQFHLDEPWNSAHNITLLDRMPAVYGKTGADTQVLVFTGPGTLFDRNQQTDVSVLTSAHASQTILVVRADKTERVAWTEPRDLEVTDAQDGDILESLGPTFLAAFCDATVRYVEAAGESDLHNMIRPMSD